MREETDGLRVMSCGYCVGCGCGDEAYMTPPTLGLHINIIKLTHLQTLARQDEEQQPEVRMLLDPIYGIGTHASVNCKTNNEPV